MDRLINLLWSVVRIYTKIKRKARINEVKEDPASAFANKFGEPERVLNDGVQSERSTTEVAKGSKRRSDFRQRSDG